MNNQKPSDSPDVVIIGASAAGLMCAIAAGKRNRSVRVLDHANKAGKKILMSGGGRCNFTNYHLDAENYLSTNPHFCKSALSRFNQWDFIAMVETHNIPYHERDHGQLFCDLSAKDILNMLLTQCKKYNITLQLNCSINKVHKLPDQPFSLKTTQGDLFCKSLVIATGGLSIPKMGASPFGYKMAKQFGIKIIPTTAGLVPLTLHLHDKEKFSLLSGIALDATVSNHRQSFRENILFTHRGLSGPAILQLSSYWQPGEPIFIDLAPDHDLLTYLIHAQQQHPQQRLKTTLHYFFPKRLVAVFVSESLANTPLAKMSKANFEEVAKLFHTWRITPNGTEGYRTAEVTVGGVDCNAISSKTMMATQVPQLYFIGEVLDVTGWLGGYNFQWAWSSGWCAGQYV